LANGDFCEDRTGDRGELADGICDGDFGICAMGDLQLGADGGKPIDERRCHHRDVHFAAGITGGRIFPAEAGMIGEATLRRESISRSKWHLKQRMKGTHFTKGREWGELEWTATRGLSESWWGFRGDSMRYH
jgi:hypothetical protein